MAKIKIISECPLYDGMPVTFQAPCDCTAVDGLNVYYGDEAQAFGFCDAHGNDLAGTGNLFAEGAYVKAILNTASGCAYLQNADTNAYLEGKFNTVQTAADNAAGAAAKAQSTADGKAAASHTHTKSQISDFPTSMTPTAHNQAASTITAGTFAATGVKAMAGTDYTTDRVRNIVMTETDPGAGTASSYANGTVVLVYE